jgi:prevent-host-death family protein
MDMKEKRIPAGQFKQHCLALMDEVARTHRPVVITKRGRPIARLGPVESEQEIEQTILAHLRSGEAGMLVDEGTFLQPSSEIADWPET